jgi:hypothetical protein
MARKVRQLELSLKSVFTQKISLCAVKGILKEKEEARNTYDDAIASGHGAYLLEQTKDELFTASIGNLPPGKEVIVWLTYVMELDFNDAGQLRLLLPEQKFAPDGINSPTFPASSTADASANESRVPSGLTMDVSFHMSSPISQIICESHPDVVTSEIIAGDPRRGSLRMPTTAKPLIVDLEILVQLENASKLSAIVQKNEKGERCAMVSFFPRLMDVDAQGEVLFLVDRSGSMQGSKMKRTVDTMQIFLRSLSPGVRFNIVSFGSTFSTLFPESKDYDEQTLAAATKLVATMSANMGGTEILAPLRSIFKKAADPKYPRQLFILTDGEVSDPSSCIRECRIAADSTRVFCFGIGSGASKQLVEGMAKAANGDFEMIGDNDRIDDKVLKQLGKALSPAITNIKIAWPEGSVERSAPFRQIPVFAGGRVTSFAWLKPDQKTLKVKLTAVGPTENVDQEEEVNVEKPTEGEFVFALAARRLMKDFDESRSYAHTSAGALESGWSLDRVKKEMIKISLETGVMCEHTSFVAVEERENATEGAMVHRKVVQAPPADLPSGGPIPQRNSRKAAAPLSFGGAARGGGGGPGRGGAVSRDRSAAPSSSSSAKSGTWSAAPLSSKDKDGGAKTKKKSEKSSLSQDQRASSTVQKPSSGIFSKLFKSSAASSASPASPASPSKPSAAPSMRQSQKEEEEERAPMRRRLSSKAASVSDASSSDDEMEMEDDSDDVPAPIVAPAPVVVKTSEGDLTRMRETILKQTAMGNWKLDDAASALKASAADITAHFDSVAAAFSSGDKRDAALSVFASALVCALFELKFAQEKVTWQLVVKKARSWITKQALTGVDWDAAAKSFLKAKNLV